MINQAPQTYQVLLKQLITDDLQVADGVNGALDVNDLVVVEHTDHVVDTVNGGDVRQESVPEAGALASALHQTSDVRHGQHRRHPARQQGTTGELTRLGL